MPRALLSVSDKRGIDEVARGLAARGFELVSTGGTARALQSAGLTVTNVSTVTGFPEMLDGRVKTLHPALHGGILARRDRPDDLAALDKLGVGLVDVVIVNLYPFAAAAANPSTTFDALVEEIDIGGPSLVRAAAKNFRHVLVVVDPADYGRSARRPRSVAEPRVPFRPRAQGHGAHGVVRHRHHRRASTRDASGIDVRAWRARSAAVTHAAHAREDPRPAVRGKPAPAGRVVSSDVAGPAPASAGRRSFRARNCRSPTFSTSTPPRGSCSSSTSRRRRSSSTRTRAERPSAARRPRRTCAPAKRIRVSAFGGIVALNRPIDRETAEAIASTRIDCVIAPSVDDSVHNILARKPNMRVVTADFSAAPRRDRSAVHSGRHARAGARRRGRGRCRMVVDVAAGGIPRRHEARSRPKRSGSRFALPGASARTSSRTRSSSRTRRARWQSAPAR